MSVEYLKRYMPRSLYGRAALILLLPVVILQIVATVLFITRFFEDVTQQMSQTVVRELQLVLETGAPQLDISLAPVQGAVPDQHMRRWYDFSGITILRILPQEVPQIRAIDLRDDAQVSVFAQTDAGMVRLEFDRRRISAANPHQLFVNMIFFGILVSVIAILYLRNQLRPIKRLAVAAEAFGRGRHVPYTPAGATEVRAAGAAFADMRQRIERHIEQRTLMLSGVSHDLRTPLTRMRLTVSMMDGPERAQLEEDLLEMQQMLDAFLDFAKGASEGEAEPVQISALLEHVVAKARRAGHAVVLAPAQGGGQGDVMVNAASLSRAVENLVGNAVRYGTRAELSFALTDKSLRISVEDDGPGIPEAQRLEATRPFTRLDPARTPTRSGSVGLGLAIANDIARAHGGMLRLGRSERLGGLRADIVIAR
jgi:two-component system osmolarity sensor histidine kinase EnvZ